MQATCLAKSVLGQSKVYGTKRFSIMKLKTSRALLRVTMPLGCREERDETGLNTARSLPETYNGRATEKIVEKKSTWS